MVDDGSVLGAFFNGAYYLLSYGAIIVTIIYGGK